MSPLAAVSQNDLLAVRQAKLHLGWLKTHLTKMEQAAKGLSGTPGLALEQACQGLRNVLTLHEEWPLRMQAQADTLAQEGGMPPMKVTDQDMAGLTPYLESCRVIKALRDGMLGA